MSEYFDQLCETMKWLGEQPNTIFIGQGVGCAGTSMTDTLKDVPPEKLLEFPVAENLQMGVAIGMALEGLTPICIFPRWNFLILAADQLVNHLDKLWRYSAGGYDPKVIIRVMVPSVHPFDPGDQHNGDFSTAFQVLLRHVRVVRLKATASIAAEYKRALHHGGSTLLVEYQDHYKVVPSGVKEGAMT